jgi:hypothetical protein
LHMPRALPFRSVKRGAPEVFHNNDGCDAGLRVESANWRAGDGGRTLCAECARRHVEDQMSRDRAVTHAAADMPRSRER